MIVTLPDGNQLTFNRRPVTLQEIASQVNVELVKTAVAATINGKMYDMSSVIDEDCQVIFHTAEDEQGLQIIRHSCAHLLAQAVKQLFPETQITIGPVIEDGFYYDFSRKKIFINADLKIIEKRMREIVKSNLKVERFDMTRDQAVCMFKKMGEYYKVKIIEEMPLNELLTFYKQGDFVDLCRGPHVANTGQISSFQLMKLAGAYWRGNSSNEMLQRIYGTAWPDKKALKFYLDRLEEAEKRDHRKLAKKHHLFHFQEEAPGMVFWHSKGWSIYNIVRQYIREQQMQHGYLEINTPQLVNRILWEKSGHWEVFRDSMFAFEVEKEYQVAIKPMNCPCHVQVYNQGVKSYRDLPLRLAEFGSCHRNEHSGALHGLMRLRNFVQDDAHIFCTEDQIQSEIISFIHLLQKIYKDFGFEDIIIHLSTRPETRVGCDKIWDKAEQALFNALKDVRLNYKLQPGAGAFYGPKIEFSLKDCLGRIWQCGTIQVDFLMPNRLGAYYVAQDGRKQVPVMLHRVVLGAFERFIGIYLEETAGNLPVWLAPIQAVILTITDNQHKYAQKLHEELIKQGIRVDSDLRNEKIGYKIREHTIQLVPFLLIIGNQEVELNCISVRTREGKNLGQMSLNKFISKINACVLNRGRKHH